MPSSAATPSALSSLTDSYPERNPKLRRRSSAASVSSTGSRSSSSSRTTRPKIIVSQKRRLLILALRYVISQKEYAYVRKNFLLKRSPSIIANTPTRGEFDAVVKSATWDDFLPASSRAGLRMFLLCNALLNGGGYVGKKIQSWRSGSTPPLLSSVLGNRPNFLSSLSLSAIIVLHRLLYRFFYQLRSNLQLPQAKDFRVKYPKASQVFLSPNAPPLAASMAGMALLLHPATDRRVTISVYTLVKALEFIYNTFEDKGWFQNRPWWFGSWILFPMTSGQLLYSFIFDRDCFPNEYGDFIAKYSPEYVQPRPNDFPPALHWPTITEIVDALPKIATLRYPAFSSPILFPNTETIPRTLSAMSPIISPAHPAIKSLQCALLHPDQPSCLKQYIHYWASELPRIAKFLAAIYAVAWIPRYKKFLANPIEATAKISSATAVTSLFITGSIGTAWAACCFLQSFLPRSFIPRARFWLAGFLGGVWAFIDKDNGRANFLYSFRIGLVSFWKILVKKGYAKPIKNGDVFLFVVAMMAINCVYERNPAAISGGAARRVLASLRGRGMRDYVKEKLDREKELEESKTESLKEE